MIGPALPECHTHRDPSVDFDVDLDGHGTVDVFTTCPATEDAERVHELDWPTEDQFAGECSRCGTWLEARATGGFRYELTAETRPL